MGIEVLCIKSDLEFKLQSLFDNYMQKGRARQSGKAFTNSKLRMATIYPSGVGVSAAEMMISVAIRRSSM